jgi:hypothetical protein
MVVKATSICHTFEFTIGFANANAHTHAERVASFKFSCWNLFFHEMGICGAGLNANFLATHGFQQIINGCWFQKITALVSGC